MTTTIRLGLVLFGGLLAFVMSAGYLSAQGDDQEPPWNTEVRKVLTDSFRRLRVITPEQNWTDEVQTVITEAEKRLKASSSGMVRTGEIQNALADALKRLKAITATGTARESQIRTVFEGASELLQSGGTNAPELKSTGSGSGVNEAAVSLQVNAPKITPIRGGYYAEFGSLTEIGSIKLGGPMTGKYEIFFDARMEDTGAAKPVDNPEFLLVLADYWIVRGKPERAIPLYELGLEKDPENFLFQNNLALLVSKAGNDHTRALNIIDGALKERADNVTLLDSKGLILINAKRSDEAVPVLLRAVELSCQKPLCVMHYAYALDLQGQESAAREWFNKALPLLETSVGTFLKDDKDMFDLLKMRYATPPAF